MKSWNTTWDKIFRTREWGKYPSEDLVRFVANNFYDVSDRKEIKILDLGCGPGSNSWYLAKEGFTVIGIDGSKTAISRARKRLMSENLNGTFKIMDFIKLEFPDNYFDFVIDICSIQHNRLPKAVIIVDEIKRVLKPDGKFFSILVAKGTYLKPYYGKGHVHFYILTEIKKLFKKFDSLTIERIERTMNNRKVRAIHWIVTGRK